MGAILFRFFEIALLRKGPQHLPAMGFLVLLAVLVHLAVTLLWVQLSAGSYYEAGVGEVLNFAMLSALSWVLLRLTGHPGRFNATLSALLGSDAIINAIAIPGVLMTNAPSATGEVGTGQLMLVLVVYVWNIAVMANILRLAANLSGLASVAIAVAYALTYFRILLGVIAPST